MPETNKLPEIEEPKLQILIVDDDAVIRLLHHKRLESASCPYPVTACANGREALTQLENNQDNGIPFLVLLDLNMPVMNGWQFLQECEETIIFEQMKVVVISSTVNAVDYERALKFNHVIGFCEKPFKAETFESIKALKELEQFFNTPS